jgi:SHS2 domain-containing protein
MDKKFETLEIATADVSYKAYGKTKEELFENAALGLFHQIIDERKIEPKIKKIIEVKGDDEVQLLHDWLGELMKLFSIDHLLFSEFKVLLSGDRVRGIARGEPYDREKHGYYNEIKAVTYHLMEIKEEERYYSCVIVCDM